jgi:hypothetical protein
MRAMSALYLDANEPPQVIVSYTNHGTMNLIVNGPNTNFMIHGARKHFARIAEQTESAQ